MQVAIFQFSLFGINTYVVFDPATDRCAIVDPGMSTPEERQAILNFIKAKDLQVTHIINTHLHLDHAVGDMWAAATFDVPVLAHKDDESLGKRLRQQAEAFGVPGQVDDVVITSYLTDGEEIKIGDGTLKVLHVPGHSPGGVALYDKEGGYVIAGDSLFNGSIGRTDLPGGSMTQLVNAVKAKLLSLPDSTVVYSGHGPATTIGKERRTNPYLV